MNINTMLRIYNKHRHNDGYIIGFFKNDNVYFITRKTLPHDTLYIDKYSGNLRMRYSEKLFNRWKHKAVACGKIEQLYDDCYNRGYMFEKMIYAFFGMEWSQDSIPFYKGNDITINGKGYSIKLLANCTICKATTIKRLAKEDRLR